MRILTCTGYYGTGSSAITDLLSEFDNCYSLTEHEIRFIHDPEGVSDLEYNLVQNHNRHNSGHALKRFKNRVDFWAGNKIIKKYEPYFNWKFKEISQEYIKDLTDFTYKGYWHQDVIDKGNLFYFRKRMLNKILQKTIWCKNTEKGLKELPNEITFCSHPSEEKFLRCTKDYTEKLFREANIENKDNIVVDQLVPPSNINRYIRYFNNIRVFLVDRDPRDIYILEKYVWKGTIVPVDNIELFCKWYKYTRSHRINENIDKENVFFVQFEDMIYKYDETIAEIIKWLNWKEINHNNKKKFFNPEISRKNTQVWKCFKEESANIKYIEENLKEYIYEYN